MYATRFVFSEEDIDVNLLDSELKNIRLKDPSFRYSLKRLRDGRYMLNVYSETRDQAHQRGMWLWDKLFAGSVGYKVVKWR